MAQYICVVCSTVKIVVPSQLKRGNRKYCSRKCRWTVEMSPMFKCGVTRSRGYVLIYQPLHPAATNNGYVLEHRLVMEEKLGRRLRKNELVHHINHVKHDNRPENLELQSKSKHSKLHNTKRVEYRGRSITLKQAIFYAKTSRSSTQRLAAANGWSIPEAILKVLNKEV